MNRSISINQRRAPSILFEGLMGKQGGNRGGLKNWKTRFFRVLGGNLEYYDPRNLRNPLGTVSLWNAVLFDLRFTNDDEQREVLSHTTSLLTIGTPVKDRDSVTSSKMKMLKKSDHTGDHDNTNHTNSMNPNTSTHCADCGQELSSSLLSFFSAKEKDGRKATSKHSKTQCAICGHYFCGFCIRDSPVANIGHVQYCNVCASEQNFFQSMTNVKDKMLDLYTQSQSALPNGTQDDTYGLDPNSPDYISQKEWLKNELKKQVFESLKHEDKDHKILEVSEHQPGLSHDGQHQQPTGTVRVSPQDDRNTASPQRTISSYQGSSSSSSSSGLTTTFQGPSYPPRASQTARSVSPKPHVPTTPQFTSPSTSNIQSRTEFPAKKDKRLASSAAKADSGTDEPFSGTPPATEFYMNPLFTISIPNKKNNKLSSDFFSDPNEVVEEGDENDDDPVSLQNAFNPPSTTSQPTGQKTPPVSPKRAPPISPSQPKDNFLTSHHPQSSIKNHQQSISHQQQQPQQQQPPPVPNQTQFSLSNHKPNLPVSTIAPSPPPRPSRPVPPTPGHQSQSTSQFQSPQTQPEQPEQQQLQQQQSLQHQQQQQLQLTHSTTQLSTSLTHSSQQTRSSLLTSPHAPSSPSSPSSPHQNDRSSYRASVSANKGFSDAVNYNSIRLKPRHAQQLPTYTVGQVTQGPVSQRALEMKSRGILQEPINLSFTIPSTFRRNCFCIKTPDRELWVNCETHHEKLKWLSVLRTVAQEVTKYSTQPFRPLPDGIEPGSILSSYGTVNQGETDVRGVLSSTILEEIEHSANNQYNEDDAESDDVANRIVAKRQQRLLREQKARERAQRSANPTLFPTHIDDPTIPPPPPDELNSEAQPHSSRIPLGLRRASVVVTTAMGTNELLVDVTNNDSIQIMTPRGLVASDALMLKDFNAEKSHDELFGSNTQVHQLQKLDEQLIQQIRLQLSQEFQQNDSNEKLLLKEELDTKQSQLTRQKNEIQLLRDKVSELDPIQSMILHTPAPTNQDSLKRHVQYHLIHEAQKLKQSQSMISVERDYSAPFPVHLRNLFPKVLPSTCINLRKRVGGGAYGDVYKGLFFGTEVAIKTLKQASIAASSAIIDPTDKMVNVNLEALQDLCREIAILSTVNHPNVVLYCGVTLSDQMIPYELLKEKEDAYVVLKSQIASIQQDADKLMLEREHHNRQYQQLQQTMGITQRSASKSNAAPPGSVPNGTTSGAQNMLLDISRQVQSINSTIQQHQIDIQQLTQDFLINTALREKQRLVEGPGLCLVTEWCERGSLFDMLYNYSIIMDTRQMFEIALDIARGMNYLHNCTPVIVHRDLKSQNILIGLDGRAKIADFGLSLTHNRHKYNTSDDENKPKYGVFGTPEWMAPEVMLGKSYNEKVDVYSFGILLTELFARQMPYTDLLKDTEYHTVAEYVIVCEQMPTVPTWCNLFLFPLIKQCLHPNSNLRPTFEYICSYFDELLENTDKDLLLLYDLKRIFYMLNDKRIEFQALGAREITNLIQNNRLFIKLDVCSRSFQINSNQNVGGIVRSQVDEMHDKLSENTSNNADNFTGGSLSKTAPTIATSAQRTIPLKETQIILRAQDREFEEYSDYIDDMAYMMTTTSISNLKLHSQLQQIKVVGRTASGSVSQGTAQPQQSPIASLNESKHSQEKLRAQLMTFLKPFSAQVQKYKHMQKTQQMLGSNGGNGNAHGSSPSKKHTQFGLVPADVLLHNTHIKCCCYLHVHGGVPSSQYLVSPNQLPLPDANTLKGYIRAHHYSGRATAPSSVSVVGHSSGTNSGGQPNLSGNVEPQLGLPHPMTITDIEKDVGTDGVFIWNDLRAYFIFKQTSHPLYSSTQGANSRYTTTHEQYNSSDASEFVHRYLKNQHSQGSISHTYSNSLYTYAARYNNPVNRNIYTTPTQIPDNDAINIILRIIYLLTNAMVPETQHEHELCYLSWVLSLFEALLGLLHICDDGEYKEYYAVNYNAGNQTDSSGNPISPTTAPVHGLYMETCYQVCHACQEHSCTDHNPVTPTNLTHRPSQFGPMSSGSSSANNRDKTLSSIVNRNHSNSFAARSGSVSQEQAPAGVTRDRLASNFQGIGENSIPESNIEPKSMTYISTRRFICDLIVDEGAFFSSLTFFGFQLRDQNIIQERIQTILEQRTKVLALQQLELNNTPAQILALATSSNLQHQQIIEHDVFIKQQHFIQELYDLNLEFDVLFNAIQLYKSTQDVAEHVLSYLITILPISLLPTLCYGVPQHIMSKLHCKVKRDLYEMYSLVDKIQFSFQRFGFQEQIFQYCLDSEHAKHNNSRDNPHYDVTIGQLQPKYQLTTLFGPRQNMQEVIRWIYLNQQLHPSSRYTAATNNASNNYQAFTSLPELAQRPSAPSSTQIPPIQSFLQQPPPQQPPPQQQQQQQRPPPHQQQQQPPPHPQLHQQPQLQQPQQQQPSVPSSPPSFNRPPSISSSPAPPPPQRPAPTPTSTPSRVSTMQQILQSQSIQQNPGNSRAPVRPAPTLPKSPSIDSYSRPHDYNSSTRSNNPQNQFQQQYNSTRSSDKATQAVPNGTVKNLMSSFQQPPSQ